MVRNSRQPEENPIQSPTIMEDNSKLSYDAVESFADVLQVEWAKGKEKIQTLENENRNLKEQCMLLATTNSNLGEDVNKANQQLREAREMRQQTIRRSHQHVIELEKRVAEAELNLNKSMPCQTVPHLELKVCHRNILEWLKNTKCRSSTALCDWNDLCDKVLLLWQNCDKPESLDEPNREWIEDCDYSVIGEQPINHFGDGCRDGSSSLVFRIQHKSKFYIVKMMINLINLQFVGHNEGHSIDQYLENNFGPEYLIPLYVSGHPNIVPVLHYYQGSTDKFQKFQKLIVPHNFDVPIEMASRTTFLVLPEYPITLKTFMLDLKDRPAQSLYGLSELFLLQLLYQLLSSIVFLRTKKIVHRDIKADNVFLDNYLRPVLGDFGFARKLYNSEGKAVRFRDKSEVAAGNSHAWAPEICRYSRYDPQHLPQSVLLEDIYNKSDGYAVSRMFYSILQPPNTPDTFPTSSVNVPHYQNSQIPNLPDTLTAEVRSILRDLVLNDPIDRPTVKQAMFRVGCMLFSPSQDEVTSFQQLKQYHEARLITLAAIDSKHWNCRMTKEKISIEESTEINSIQIEAHFLTNIRSEEFWEIHRTRTLVDERNGQS
ncbi:hypothetical protein LOTGIDRAFT_173399 [Lottia gigantea]|uniref:Protein kinase domain-containing protein n=1 Tax=Lottia gigantea TaxID=225164 RepID=V4ASB3_LOTGI|nr:hypothetical protein LOTGIDRAFT_173399 [Lottia gigantea]ESP00163.1 hypothetical protein LOTGIDRAFT_173399 [Lottia gigantea]